MGGQAQENISQNWLTPEALIDFIEELRHVGFNIGMAEYIAAQDLLLMLIARGESLQEPRRAASLLGPLLCSSPAEQDAFPDYFERWAKRHQASLISEPLLHEETMAEALDNTARRGLRWEWLLFVVGVIVLVIASWYISRNFINTELPSSGVVEQPLPDTAASDTLPLIQLASVAIGVLILASVAWWVWWRRVANQFLQRRQGEGEPDIKQISLTASDEALFPSLTFLSLARMFRQREQVVSRELNVVRTVKHSVEQGGWLNPIYDRLLIPPEYLVLVDRRSRFDHLAEFVEGMVKRLETHGVFITAYAFDGDPRLCFPLQGKDAPRSLNELAARYDNMRLIIFSEAQGLLSPVSGRLAPWSRLFNRWIHRSVLTPESPTNWGVTEHELQREFTVLPGTTDGLATFMRIIQGEEKVGEINAWADSSVPAVLQERPQRWIERDAPLASQIDALLEELKVYLGEEGYAWFESCAVYPGLQWQITLTLGKLLKDKSGISLLDPKRMIDLARLPWFRYGIMPDWLRTRLVLNLSPKQEEEVRAALEVLLVTAVQGHGASLDLEVAHERRDWTSKLARPLLRLLRSEVSSDSPIQDHVFLDFMLQRFNLAVRVPETLRRQLFTRTGDQLGWKTLLQWTIANLLAAGVVIFFELVYPLSTRSQYLALLVTGLEGLVLGLAQWFVLRRFWKVSWWLWMISGVLGICATQSLGSIKGSGGSGGLYGSEFGLFNLIILGLIQAGILSRQHISSVRFWWIGALSVGGFNTILSFFFKIDSSLGFSSNLQLVIYFFICGAVNAIISGWILLSVLRSQTRASTWLLRPTWIFANAIGFSFGLMLSIAISTLFENSTSNSKDSSIIVISIFWSLCFVLSQWLALRSYQKYIGQTWFWLSIVPSASGFILIMTSSAEKTVEDPSLLMTFILGGIGLGILLGLAQSFVWYRNGLKPYQLLVWFLSSIISMSLLFVVLEELIRQTDIFTQISSLDQVLLVLLLPALLPGFITSLPLEPFLREAIRYQQVSKGSESYISQKLRFSPLAIISKLRSRNPSARNSL